MHLKISEQSRIVRVRTQVIWMLFVMMIVNLVCWTPWWIYTLLYTNLGDTKFFENIFPKVKDVFKSAYLLQTLILMTMLLSRYGSIPVDIFCTTFSPFYTT